MRALAYPALAALIGCTAAAPPLTAADCTGSPRDVRDGVVSWQDGATRTVLDCRSGDGLTLNVPANTGPLGTRDVSGEVSAWLASVPEPDRLGQIRAAFTAMAVTHRTTAVATETCACAALYPELRGAKQKYEGTT